MKHIYIVAFVYITSVPILAKRFIEFNEEPTDVVVMRNKPAELRCNITGINSVAISWTKDGVLLDLKNDTRRTILPHGSLYFKTIIRKKKFSPDTGVYRCYGETNVNGRSFKIVSQKARLTIIGMSKSFSETPQDLTVSEGDTAWFKCELKRSRPAAKITWSKEGKNTDLSLNFRFVVFPSGILEILSVMPSDAGNYICKATNEELGKYITAKAKLTITPASPATRPHKFLVKPSDVKALYGTNAILECIATGYPKLQVDWYKDGKKITLTKTGHFIKYGASSLNISDVKPGDSGKYECGMGTVSAEATLQVIVPPLFKVLPKDIETNEGKDITISCVATGSPQPKISWFKNGDTIDGIEHISIEKDSITIMEVLNNDEGIYQCVAKNDGGEIRASAQLHVYDPQTTPQTTTIVTTQKIIPTTAKTTASHPMLAPSAPNNVRAVVLNTTAIHVMWQPPDQPHGVIKKYTVVTHGYSAGNLKFESMLTTQKTSLIVTELKPATKYQFVVYASNEHKKGALSASVQEYTKTPTTSSLGPPRDVQVISKSPDALKVTWKPPIIDTLVIKNYSIKYRDVDHTQWHVESSLTHNVVLFKLHPYTMYSVKVTAHTDRGPGQTSDEIFERTKSGKPKGPPENVKVISTNDVLVASWGPPSQPNGNITGYVLRLKNENTGIVSNFKTNRNNKVFNDVEKSATYGFQVAAVTEAGQGEFSGWVTKDMPSKPQTEDVVPGKPTNLRTRVVFGMVQVSWSAPKENHVIVREYILSYGKMRPDGHTKHLPNNVTSYLLQNLQSEAIYIIRVRAANKMGLGLEALEEVIIPRSKQSSAIFSLQALPIKKRTIKLSWIDPTNRADFGYHVKFEKDNKWIDFNVTGRTSFVVKNLRAGMFYTFSVKRDDEFEYSIVSNTTREEAPGPPKDVTVSIDSGESTVNVHWNTPDHPNGKLTNYKICWRPENNHRKKNWTCKMVKAHVLNEQISNINATLKYSVKILAKNRAGEGEFSETKEFYRGPKSIIRSPDKNIDGLNRTTTYRVTESTTNVKGTPTTVNKEKVAGSKAASLTSDEKTLWIVIAVIATVTLIAILVISIILCKKRSHDSPDVRRKPPPHPYKAVANGSGKKKGSNKDHYWIKQDNMDVKPCVEKKSNDLVESTIPRNADEMKPLDSPFQSRKDCASLERGEVEDEQPVERDQHPASSLADQHPYKHREDYQPLPIIEHDHINIHQSPFISVDHGDIPSPRHECLDNTKDDGAATSSDYGSEEIVTVPCVTDEPPTVTYMTKNTPNGCVSVASDYNYPHKHATGYDIETHTLQSLMKDLESIMAKEDRV